MTSRSFPVFGLLLALPLLSQYRTIVPSVAFSSMSCNCPIASPDVPAASKLRNCRFDRKISREVLENYLSRAISMEGLLNGRGDLDDNVRMLKQIGAKFAGRSLCLWGNE